MQKVHPKIKKDPFNWLIIQFTNQIRFGFWIVFFYYSFSFHEYICGIQYVFIFVPQQRCSSSLVILILGVVAFIDLTGKKCASPITDFLLKGGVHSYTLYPQHFPTRCDILDRDVEVVEPLPQGRHPKKSIFFRK